jgi:hypothetical protein
MITPQGGYHPEALKWVIECLEDGMPRTNQTVYDDNVPQLIGRARCWVFYNERLPPIKSPVKQQTDQLNYIPGFAAFARLDILWCPLAFKIES